MDRLRQLPLVFVGAAAARRRLSAEGHHAVARQARRARLEHTGEVAQIDLSNDAGNVGGNVVGRLRQFFWCGAV